MCVGWPTAQNNFLEQSLVACAKGVKFSEDFAGTLIWYIETHTAHTGTKKLTVTAYITLADFCFTFQIDKSLKLYY